MLERSRPSSPCFFFFSRMRVGKERIFPGPMKYRRSRNQRVAILSPPNKNIACAAIMRLSARNARVISVGSESSRGVRGSIRIREQSGLGVSLTLQSVGRFDHRFRKDPKNSFPRPLVHDGSKLVVVAAWRILRNNRIYLGTNLILNFYFKV